MSYLLSDITPGLKLYVIWLNHCLLDKA